MSGYRYEPASAQRHIPHGLSVYLDAVRFCAALVVVLSHLWSQIFPQLPLPWPGHSAVVVFFVLSGFVISHAARPGIGLAGYLRHRIARIYPVALAAILLSIALGMAAPAGGLHGPAAWDILRNALFLGQSWGDVALPYNGPFWSLNYEVWYYVLFGLWCYRPHPLLLAAAALLAGPKILLLMPVWLLGVLLHRHMPRLAPRRALLLFLLSLAAALAFFWFDLGIRIREAMRLWWPGLIAHARGSNQFAGDFLLGLIVAANFMAAGSLGMGWLLKAAALVRYLSSYTFSMYVFHIPLSILAWQVLEVRFAPAFFALLFAGTWALGELTERRTAMYRALLGRLAAALRAPRRVPAASLAGPPDA